MFVLFIDIIMCVKLLQNPKKKIHENAFGGLSVFNEFPIIVFKQVKLSYSCLQWFCAPCLSRFFAKEISKMNAMFNDYWKVHRC